MVTVGGVVGAVAVGAVAAPVVETGVRGAVEGRMIVLDTAAGVVLVMLVGWVVEGSPAGVVIGGICGAGALVSVWVVAPVGFPPFSPQVQEHNEGIITITGITGITRYCTRRVDFMRNS